MNPFKIFIRKTPVLLLFFMLGFFSAQSQLVISVTVTQQACANDGAAYATITGGTPPYQCYWEGSNWWATGLSVTNLPSGYYRIAALDTLGNFGDTVIYIGVVRIDSLSATPEHCIQGDGTISVFTSGGTAPFNYIWDNGVTHTSSLYSDMLSNLSTGMYGVTITDANGCWTDFVNDSIDPYMPGLSPHYVFRSSPVTTIVSTTPCNCNDGSATVIPANGTAPYTYYWTNIVPPQLTQTATGLDAFTLTYVVVTDAVGCQALNYAEIDPGPNYIESTALVNYTICPQATGSITISPSGGTAPYSLLWNTGDTTATIINLAYGNYSCTITDAAGCSVIRNKFVDQVSPLSVILNIDSATCGNADGLVTAIVTGGTPPYAYEWTDSSSASFAFLEAGWQYISVIDMNNCPALVHPFYVYQPDSCYAYITGTVWHDINGNCIHDGGEFGLGYPVMQLSPGNIHQNDFLYTDMDGYYAERIIPGNYVLDQDIPDSWTLQCPSSSTIPLTVVGGQNYVNDYYDHPDSLFDDWTLNNYWCADTIVHGIPKTYHIEWRNSGTTSLNGNIEVHFDPQMDFLGSQPMPDFLDTIARIAYYSIPSQHPRWFGSIRVTVMVPANVPIGDTVKFISVITPIVTDARPADNTDTCISIVAGSYDPNNKTVVPRGSGSQGFISTADSILHYTVNFQNTGSWFANHVRIVDTLDNHLDPSTLKFVSKMPFNYGTTATIDGQIVTFDFPNIYLPDSTRDEAASHGYVSYAIKQKPGLHVGDIINNKAYIYFDFNEAIITNEVVNTIHSLISVDEIDPGNSFLQVFPNPVTDLFEISFHLESEVTLAIYDALGKKVFEKSLSPAAMQNQKIELSAKEIGFSEGIFFATLVGENVVSRKFIFRD